MLNLTIFNSFPEYESNLSNLKFFVATRRCRLGVKRANKADSDDVIVR